jgi:hypothetical protein
VIIENPMTQPGIPRTLNVVLVLELDELPIAGTVQSQTIQPLRFDGWLELIAAIETSLSVAREHLTPIPQGSTS